MIIANSALRASLAFYHLISNARSWNNKHLMTGPKGNSEFCFPETSMFPMAKPRGTLRLEGKQNSLFPEGPVIKCFVVPPNSKYRV